MEIRKLNSLDKEVRKEVSTIFVNGFYQWLKFFSKDREKLISTFQHIFNDTLFYIALIDNEVAGMAACSYNGVQSVKLNKREFKKNLGFLRGPRDILNRLIFF